MQTQKSKRYWRFCMLWALVGGVCTMIGGTLTLINLQMYNSMRLLAIAVCFVLLSACFLALSKINMIKAETERTKERKRERGFDC